MAIPASIDTCTRKIRYQTKDEARAALKKMPAQYHVNRPYKCPFCKGFHLGRPGGPR